MIAIYAQFNVKLDKLAEFEEVVGTMARLTRENEPDILTYQLCKSPKVEGRYSLMEIYKDKAALDAHFVAPHFKEGGAKLGDLCVEPPKLEKFETL